jgi:hypothetical protein
MFRIRKVEAVLTREQLLGRHPRHRPAEGRVWHGRIDEAGQPKVREARMASIVNEHVVLKVFISE